MVVTPAVAPPEKLTDTSEVTLDPSDPLAEVIGIGDSLLRPSKLYENQGGIGKGDPNYSIAEHHDDILYGPLRRREDRS